MGVLLVSSMKFDVVGVGISRRVDTCSRKVGGDAIKAQ